MERAEKFKDSECAVVECPMCKAQMRIIAFIQDANSIKDIMKAQGFGRELSRTVSRTSKRLLLFQSSSIP